MSQANVEIVRAVYDAFTRRDQVTPFQAYAPDVEWDVTGLGHAVWKLSGGKIVRLRVYLDRNEALKAAGLGC
jgi:ketosteroid isomerase-like protein